MKRHAGFASGSVKRYAVVVLIVIVPLLWSLPAHRADDSTPADPVFVAGAPLAAPDFALLVASDVERALPDPPRVMPEALARTSL